ncbi:MAG: DUF6273 domain-containing protein [Oscillospiraceae bacterium]|nr:DUF6273 domain-containing protein [Oscillospiraceae bacterium]
MKKLLTLTLTMFMTLTLIACAAETKMTDPPSGNPLQNQTDPTQQGDNGNPGSSTDVNGEPVKLAVEVGDIIQFGSYDWLVLDIQDDKALIISEKVIDSRAYHHSAYPIEWEYCELRSYLNNDFLYSFNESDRERIIETRIENKDNQWYGTYAGNDTVDRIFLLSLEEVVRYFGDSGKLTNRPNDNDSMDGILNDEYNEKRIANHVGGTYEGCYYDENQERYILDGSTVTITSGDYSLWWLRSPGDDNYYAVCVDDGLDDSYASALAGSIFVLGYDVDFCNGGVRPALWLDLNLSPNKPPSSNNGGDTNASFGSATISLFRTTIAPQGTLGVTVEGATQDMISAGAFVGMYDIGAAHDLDNMYHRVVTGETDAFEVWGPSTAGIYELRLYGSSNPSADTFVTSVEFTVN